MIHHRTPLLPSRPLETRVGRPVWLKMESSQPCGSFKLRGMGRACEAAVARGATQLVSSSGGNAGYAVAWAGRQLGVPVTVVVPRRTSERMRALISAEGATVEVAGEVWDDAHAAAQLLAASSGGALIHPFDDPEVWEGHATLVDEVAAELAEPPGVVVVAVGGGGLLCGVVLGMRRHGWTEVPIVAVETFGAASYARALEAGEPVTLASIDTIALTLGARRVCARSVELARAHPIVPWQCDDAQALAACRSFLDDHRTLVEPSCGAALAAVYGAAEALWGRAREGQPLPRLSSRPGPVLVVVCGGAAVTAAGLA